MFADAWHACPCIVRVPGQSCSMPVGHVAKSLIRCLACNKRDTHRANHGSHAQVSACQNPGTLAQCTPSCLRLHHCFCTQTGHTSCHDRVSQTTVTCPLILFLSYSRSMQGGETLLFNPAGADHHTGPVAHVTIVHTADSQPVAQLLQSVLSSELARSVPGVSSLQQDSTPCAWCLSAQQTDNAPSARGSRIWAWGRCRRSAGRRWRG